MSVSTGRMCATCTTNLSGRYLNCKACRYKAKTEYNHCPRCGGTKTRRATICVHCNRKRRGPEHPSWKGGVSVNTDGYLREFAPDHPRAEQGTYVKQHHLVMERTLGRLLLPGENVHHLNGNRQDNRPENLELWVSSQPSGQRVEDLVSWAREILATYAAEMSA